jgi:hypothetical protein
VVELAVPPSCCLELASHLAGQGWLMEYDVRIQMRRAAGLFYLVALQLPLELLDALQETVQRLGGFLQMMQLPSKRWGDASLMNLPADPVVRSLLKTLKDRYDPKGVLFTPNMPL